MPSRREFTLAGSSLIAALAAAGCTGSDDNGDDTTETDGNGGTGENGNENGENGGNGGQTGEYNFDRRSPGRYSTLVHDGEARPVNVVGQKLENLFAVEDYDPGEDEVFFGTNASDVEYTVNVTMGSPQQPDLFYALVFGAFDFETLREDLEADESYSTVTEAEAYGGFRTLEAEGQFGLRLFGHDENTLVNTIDQDSHEAAIDTVNEEADLLNETSETFQALAEGIGDPDIFLFYIDPLEGQLDIDPTGQAIGGAAGIELAEGESEYRAAVRYETEDEAIENEGEVRDGALDEEDALVEAQTQVDGQMVLVRGTLTTAELN